MTFEKKFPSLTHPEMGLMDADVFNAGGIKELKIGGWFHEDTLIDKCLDKQRVKEVLNNHWTYIHMDRDIKQNVPMQTVDEAWDLIYSELGLK